MKPKPDGDHRSFVQRRISQILLFLHILVYLVVWIAAISRGMAIEALTTTDLTNVSNYVSVFQNQILLALFWIPLLLVHVGAHLYFTGRSTSGINEREAYREGFRDGARHSSEQAYDARRLSIDDDGELIEWGDKQKHSER